MKPLLALVCLCSAGVAQAADWPHWRGAAVTGISSEEVPSAFPGTGPKVLWKAQVGIGFSSFAVADGRVVTMGWGDDKDTVACLDAATGKDIWRYSYEAEALDHYYEGGPSATPAIDGDTVFTLCKWGEVFCFDVKSGKVLWTKNYSKDLDIPGSEWGFSGSPLIKGTTLYLNIGSHGLAVEKGTGKVIWSSDKSVETGYCTPTLAKIGAQEVLLVANTKAYLALDPTTGKELWNIPWGTRYGINAADPIVSGSQLFISTGYGKGAALLDVGGTEPKQVYQSREMRTQMNPCVLIDGFLYGIDGDENSKTNLKCMELATGKVKWQEPTQKSGSVVAAKDKLILLSGSGELTVAKASPEGFDALATAQILSGKCWSVPVLANGRLYARNAAGDVVCLEMK